MFKMFYLLIVLVVWCETQRHAFAQDTQRLTISDNAIKYGIKNWTAITEELSKKTPIAISGNNHYNMAQQIFYIYNEEQLKKMLMNNMHLDKMDGTTHKLLTRRVTWNSARRFCADEGGYLAIVNSDAEEQLLIGLMNENKVNTAWLGIHDLYNESEWVTINGESLEKAGYARWAFLDPFGQQPDNFGGSQNCGVLLAKGGMDDISCNSVEAFICEMSM